MSRPAMPVQIFLRLLAARGLPAPVPEYRFHAVRKWRLDWAWPAKKVGLEVDGSIWTGGRHTRGPGWLKDTEKLNTAATMGWRLLRCQPTELVRIETLDYIEIALKYTPCN